MVQPETRLMGVKQTSIRVFPDFFIGKKSSNLNRFPEKK